jgi:glycosyltransferase involved in cell wall biosynthesis/GT2 family glycosyltransferase
VPDIAATVVVPTRDRPLDLARMLRSLAAQRTERRFEVVLVDDGSEPPASASSFESEVPLRVIRRGGGGPAAARNAGAAEGHGNYLLFTDDDTELAPTWVEAACTFLDDHPGHVGVEGPVSSPPFDPLYEHSLENDRPGAYWTCNIAYRSDTFRQLSGFLENFPDPHCEDLDLAYRAEELGPIGFASGMSVLHHPRALPLRGWMKRARLTGSEAVLFARHRERFGRAARLPARLFPVTSALHNWAGQLRAQAPDLLRSPRRLGRFLVVASAYIGTVVMTAARPRRTGRQAAVAVTRPVRVLFLMPLAHRHGGAENILWSFLQNVDRSRVEPTLVFFEDGPFRAEVASLGMSTHVLRPEDCPRPRIALFPPRVARIVRREAPDLIFSWLVEAQPFASIAGVLTGRARRIAWWQANTPQIDFVERMATALPARAVFMYSHATAAVQRSIWPHRETIVVHPGIDVPARVPEAELARLRDELGLPCGSPVIGIVGRLCSWKGQHHVVRAVGLLRERGHDVHGLIVGGNAYDFEPEYEPRLRALTTELGLDDHVTFTGQVPDGTVHMQLMDVVANASDHEPFGIVLLEAMALGVPVVAVAAGGPAEIVEDGASGLLVPEASPERFADAFERILSSDELRDGLAAGGAQAVEARFTTGRMVEQLSAAIERLNSDAGGLRRAA